MRKEERKLRKLARRYGREVEPIKTGHYRLTCKHGSRPAIYCASTPKNFDYWLRAVERDLRRYNKGC